MAGGLLQYSGLVTKTKAMHGRLLTSEELSYLTELETVDDFISYLKESAGYHEIYESHEEIHHRSQVEAILHNSLYLDYKKLYQFADSEPKSGLELLFLRYETNILKKCLDVALHGGKERDTEYLKMIFDRHSSFDTGVVTQARSLQELSNALLGTPYENLFLRFAESESMESGDMAFALDIFYYQMAWKKIGKIQDQRMKKILKELIGTEIDWQNIMWIYRSKQFYSMKPREIEANLIPVRYRLKKTELEQMTEAESVEQLLEILRKSVYVTEKNPLVSMREEITFLKIKAKTYDRLCRKYPYSIAPVLKYLEEKEIEIDRLATILEGVRYQIPAREIREMILIL